jgi:predicted GNAT family N-acyltransferase
LSTQYFELVELRNQILRRPLGLELSNEQINAENNDFHFGCYHQNALVGCLILSPVSHSPAKIKMRQVAVAEKFQRTGVGQAMVAAAEKFASEKGFKEIVLHARDTAVPFYLKLKYQIIDEPFTEVGIPHRRMIKNLDKS